MSAAFLLIKENNAVGANLFNLAAIKESLLGLKVSIVNLFSHDQQQSIPLKKNSSLDSVWSKYNN